MALCHRIHPKPRKASSAALALDSTFDNFGAPINLWPLTTQRVSLHWDEPGFALAFYAGHPSWFRVGASIVAHNVIRDVPCPTIVVKRVPPQRLSIISNLDRHIAGAVACRYRRKDLR